MKPGAPVVQSVNATRTTAPNGTAEEIIRFLITEDVPQVVEANIFPSFTRYDGNSSSFSFHSANGTLTFQISPVDIYASEGNYTVGVSNPAGASTSTVYLDVQSES